MLEATKKQLLEINRKFYQQQALSFAATRQRIWPGWKKLTPWLDQFQDQDKVRVLDVGCGNGRFMKFLESQPIEIEYWGIDSSQKLLDEARKRRFQGTAEFKRIDVAGDVDWGLEFEKFDVIVSFGLLHHIPSFKLRAKVLKRMLCHLDERGILIVSFWRFMENKRLAGRVLSRAEVKKRWPRLAIGDLEESDFFLPWGDSQSGVRYCHYFSKKEVEALSQAIEWKVKTQFSADGVSGELNTYVVAAR